MKPAPPVTKIIPVLALLGLPAATLAPHVINTGAGRQFTAGLRCLQRGVAAA
jgi:hypothetical protein